MIVLFLVSGILAGAVGMIAATVLGLGLGLILAAYPVFGMLGVCLTASLTLVRRSRRSRRGRQSIPAAESSLG